MNNIDPKTHSYQCDACSGTGKLGDDPYEHDLEIRLCERCEGEGSLNEWQLTREEALLTRADDNWKDQEE